MTKCWLFGRIPLIPLRKERYSQMEQHRKSAPGSLGAGQGAPEFKSKLQCTFIISTREKKLFQNCCS